MFQNAVNKYATTFTTTLFFVSTISGVFLFFHIAGPFFKGMHEWLSMVLLIPVGFHLYKNWNSFLTYFRRKTIYVPIAASLVAAGVFMAAGANGGGSPIGKIVHAIETSSVAEVAPIFDKTSQEMIAYLQDRGFKASSEDETLLSISRKSGTSPRRIISVIAAGS